MSRTYFATGLTPLWRHDSLAIFEGAPPKSSKFIRRPTLQYRGTCHPPLPIPSQTAHPQALEATAAAGGVDIDKKLERGTC